MEKKVIVAGHICLDMTPVFLDGGISLSQLLSPGKLVQIGVPKIHIGGCVANTGLGMKMLGADVRLIAKVGNDMFGSVVREFLSQRNALEGLVTDAGRATSYSIIFAVPGIDRIFLHHNGANNGFCSEDVPDEALMDAALFHFGYPSSMEKMYEGEGRELEKLMKRAKKAGCATSLDMASVDPASPAGKADWEKILEKTLPYVDFFVPSVEELAFMLDRPLYDKWQQRAADCAIEEMLDIEREVAALADQAINFGVGVILVKCGALGMYWRTAGEKVLEKVGARANLNIQEWANKSGFEESFVPEQVVSGTGAGDVSIAAFLTAMIKGRTPEECVRLATAAGACSVEGYESFGTLRSLKNLEKRIASGWQKQRRER